MAIWWMTEAVPIPVTALLPLVLFPFLGVLPMPEAAAPYANDALVLGLAMGVFADTMLLKVGSIFVAMTGATLCMPLLNTIVSHRSPLLIRGQMLGIAGAAASWGRVAGPLLAGFNLALFGYHGAWFGSLFISLFYMAWCYREYSLRGHAGPPPA